MLNRTEARLTGLTLILAAGFAQGVLAQNTATSPEARKAEAQRTQEMQKQPVQNVNQQNANQNWAATDFRSCHWLSGRDVVNYSDETVGDVTDMILDRGTGRVAYVVIKTGAVLGMGGRSVTVPHDQLQWNAAKERYVLNASAEQLRMYPAFSADDWKGLSSSSPAERTQVIPNSSNSNNGVPRARNPGQSTSGSAAYDQGRTKADVPSERASNNHDTTHDTTTTTTTRTTTDTSPTPSKTYTPGTPGTPDGADPNRTRADQGSSESKVIVKQDWNKPSQPADASTGRYQDRMQDGRKNISAVPGQLNPGQSAAGGSATYQDSTSVDPKLSDWMWTQSRTSYSEPYVSQWDIGQKQRIEGEIMSVTRENSTNDNVVVEVKTQDGITKKVVLGPSWYISGGETTLNRGDRVTLDVVPVNLATSAKVNGRDIAMRSTTDGSNVWSSKSFKNNGQSYSAPYYRHVLLSSLKDARLDCRGSVCGRVNDVVIEANSGTIAFLSIDPNENFMGIADTKRLVPYAVANVGIDGTVRLDVSKEMVVASTETPSDLSTLNASNVYNAYQIATPTYQRWSDDPYNMDQNRRDRRFNEDGMRRTDAEVEPR